MERKETTVAIDFGTTNSLVCVYNKNKVECVCPGEYNEQGSNLIPSFVEYAKKDVVVGKAAKRNLGRPNHFVVAAVKRIIGLTYEEYEKLENKNIFGCSVIRGSDGYPRFVVNGDGDTKTPIEVASEIFKVLKKRVDEITGRDKYNPEQEISNSNKPGYSKAFVTVPANFRDHQCKAIIEAARLANIQVEKLIPEPTAAALSWCLNNMDSIHSGEKLLVYDFGGGTFDVSLLQYSGDGKFHIQNTGGNPYLGGNDIDFAIIDYIIKKTKVLCEDEQIIENLNKLKEKKNRLNKLKSEVEKRKCLLTNKCTFYQDEKEFYDKNESKSIDISCDCIDKNLKNDFALTPKDLNNAISEKINDTISISLKVLESENLRSGNIRHIICVGGSSRLHLVKQKLMQVFTSASFIETNPDEAVARGAMELVLLNSDDDINRIIKQKVVVSYGLQTGDNRVALILKKGAYIPALSNDVTFTPLNDYEKEIYSVIYQWVGEPNTITDIVNGVSMVPVSECIRIDTLSFENMYPKTKDKQHFVIRFYIDFGGTLEVICKDNDENVILSQKSFGAVYDGH